MSGAGPAATAESLWLRAAVLGSLWAAVEIVLGSFLHNLRVPLRGHLLTAAAVAILVAAHRLWPQHGLFWRSGLIAAAMKSVSPSAVLLGPMLAIVMEGVALEAGVRLLGRRRIGYALGGALAMSWTFLHQVGGLLLTYGANIARLYAGIVTAAERAVGDLPLGVWGPLTALAALNVTAGSAAALAGWSAGATARESSVGPALTVVPSLHRASETGLTRHSLLALAVLVTALPLGLVGLGRLPLPLAATLVAAFAALCLWRYRGAVRRLARPLFWFSLVVMAAAAGLVLGSREDPFAGLAVGFAMAVRALFVTVCFAGLSRELANPRLVALVGRRGGGRFLSALEVAFATLPEVIAALPPAREIARRPRRAMASLLPHLDRWLAQATSRAAGPPMLHVVTGPRGAGKSTLLRQTVDRLRASGVAVRGIWAPGEMRDGERWSFDAVDLATGERRHLARRDGPGEWPAIGPFRVDPEALAFARRTLDDAATSRADIVAIDEVGPWELTGNGYAAQLDALRANGVPLLLVIREELLAAVIQRWAALRPTVWRAANHNAQTVATAIVAELEAGRKPL